MAATSEPFREDSDNASGLVNRLRWPVLLLLCTSCGVWCGAHVQEKVDRGQRLSLLERMVDPIREAPANAVKVISDPQHLKQLDTEAEKRVVEGKVYEVGRDAIPIDVDFLYSRYDADHDTLSVIVRNLSTHQVEQQWVWSHQELEEIYSAWLRRHEDSFVFADPLFGELPRAGLRCPTLLADGRLVVQVGQTLCCFDPSRSLVWISQDYSHHSVEVGPDGSIWTCSLVPDEDARYREEQIVQIDASTGETLLRRNLEDIFRGTPEHDYSHHNQGQRSPFHLNDVQPVSQDTPFWKSGDLFLSVRNINRVLLYRPSTNQILWSSATHWSQQHDVETVGDSTITVFDNNVMKNLHPRGYRFKHGDFNRCVAYNFRTGQYSPLFEGIFEACGCRTEREGRVKWFPEQQLLFVEASEQSLFVVADLETSQAYRMVIPGGEDGRAAHLGWYRLVVD